DVGDVPVAVDDRLDDHDPFDTRFSRHFGVLRIDAADRHRRFHVAANTHGPISGPTQLSAQLSADGPTHHSAHNATHHSAHYAAFPTACNPDSGCRGVRVRRLWHF